MSLGNMPNDGGYFLFNDDEMNSFVKLNPKSDDFFRPFMGAKNYLNDTRRWCLWLKDVNPNEIRSIPAVLERVSQVKQRRSESPREATRRLSQTPTLFGEIRQPESDYLLIPRHSSENRNYIPMGFLLKNHSRRFFFNYT